MKKLPLTNIETKNIPIGDRLKGALAKNASIQPLRLSSHDANAVSCKLDVPVRHSCNKILKNIKKLEEENPDLTQMMEDKMSSPHTAKYIRKKKASRVNVSESKQVFQDLVSADISQGTLVKGLEEELRHRATIAQPIFQPVDPEPVLADYFNEDEFVSVRVVGPSNIFPVKVQKSLFNTDHSDVTRYCNRILDKI